MSGNKEKSKESFKHISTTLEMSEFIFLKIKALKEGKNLRELIRKIISDYCRKEMKKEPKTND